MHLHHSLVELEVLLARIDRGELDTGWAEGPGWDRRRQQLLVDSVLRNWPVPPIVIGDEDDRETLLDGRERLRALWRFARDDFPVAGGPAPGDDSLAPLDGLLFSRLPDRSRRHLLRYAVPVVRVSDHRDGEVRELMSRWDPAAAPVPAARTASAPLQAPPTVPEPPPPVPAPAPPADPPAGAARPPGAHRRSAASEPIFDELSAWFLDDAAPTDAAAWSSPADTGYEEARAALRESTVELTPAGLPIRRPAAHLAPGAIRTPAPARPAQAPDPRSVGEHLSRFREGASAARHDLSPPA